MTVLRQVGRSDSLGLLWRLPTALQLLVVSQFAFNVGFYLVVPFIAAHLSDDLALAGWIVGLVLGLRTFSQQGLFFLGGALADRFGIRRTILLGVSIRILGFVVTGMARDVWSIMLGVVLIGFAAALFSPAVESAITAWAGDLEQEGGPRRVEVIGLEVMASKLGTIVGPLLGGVLLVIPFATTCLVAAGIFGCILLAHLIWLPAGSRAGASSGIRESMGDVLGNRLFLLFALIHCTYLLSYNQLYLALPVELHRIGAPSANITWLFGLAAVLVIGGQLPVTRFVARWSVAKVFGWGYALMAAGFLGVAVLAVLPVLPGWFAYLPAVWFVLGLHLGQILVLPAARTVVAELAGGRRLGSHLGMLASVGGVAVLLGSTAIGVVLPRAATTSGLAFLPWLLLAVPPALSAVGAVAFSRRHLDPSSRKGNR
ncbi:MAG: MFS transporter [Arachnia propionica]|uniref:MFS transporter n=1 Tax=Arachnia propionica TaxID=1750 RepID=UPI0026FE99EF|nr:MFS transporter [Arachnia propionica]